jgi:transposase
MAIKRRQFSREFKQEAVRLWAESGRPLTHIARELAVRTEQLRRWRRQFEGARPEAAPRPESAELRQLRRELELTRQERDFLKKAAAYFAKESR